MRADDPAARLAIATLAAVLGAGVARAADVAEPGARDARDVSTLTARQGVLTEQTHSARAAARWRLRALRRIVAAGGELAPVTRARAIDAGTRALARELSEARSLDAERVELGAERDALASSARQEEVIGAAPPFVAPVAGAVLARFGVAPDRETGVLVPRAGVRFAAAAGAPVRAPAAGVVVLVAREPEGMALVLDLGAGWSTIVGGLGALAVDEGAHVVAGQELGAAAKAAIALEVWRGRRPVDPLLFVGRLP